MVEISNETKVFLKNISSLSGENKLIVELENDLKENKAEYKNDFFEHRKFLFKLFKENKGASEHWDAHMHYNIGTTMDDVPHEIRSALALDGFRSSNSPTKTEHLVHSMIGTLILDKPIDCYLGETTTITEDICAVITKTANEIGLTTTFINKGHTTFKDEPYQGKHVIFEKKKEEGSNP